MFSIVVRVWLWFSTILSELTSSGVWNINKRLYFYERKSNSGTDGCIHISFEAPGGPFEMQLLSPCSVWPKTQPATKQSPKAEEKAASRNQKQLKVLEHQKNFKGGLPFPFSRLSQYFFFVGGGFSCSTKSPLYSWLFPTAFYCLVQFLI